MSKNYRVYDKKVTRNPITGNRRLEYSDVSGWSVAFGAVFKIIASIIACFAIATKPTEEEVEAARVKEEARQASSKAGYSAVEAEANREARIAELEAELAKLKNEK